MEYKLKNRKIIVIREGLVNDASEALKYMQKVNSETKNLLREPLEFKMTLKEEETFIENAKKSKNSYFLVVLHKGEIISTAGFNGSGLKRVNHRISIGMSVLKEYQNMGIGTLVMRSLIKRARELNKTKMELEVRVDNESAIHLYDLFGFEVEGTIKNGFFVDSKYIDLLLMGKLL